MRDLGPADGDLTVRTYREGVGAKIGHDLVIEVTEWRATVELGEQPSIVLTADPASLHVREGTGGVAPLTDRDRREIRKNIERKVLGRDPIGFRSTAVRHSGGRLVVDGELTMAGSTRPVTVQVEMHEDGRVTGSATLAQTAWGITPYRGLLGALKVRDEVEVTVEARPPR
jgi:hypothetical protein